MNITIRAHSDLVVKLRMIQPLMGGRARGPGFDSPAVPLFFWQAQLLKVTFCQAPRRPCLIVIF